MAINPATREKISHHEGMGDENSVLDELEEDTVGRNDEGSVLYSWNVFCQYLSVNR